MLAVGARRAADAGLAFYQTPLFAAVPPAFAGNAAASALGGRIVQAGAFIPAKGMNQVERVDGDGHSAGRISAGLIVIAVGVALLVDRLELADSRMIGRLWPFVVLILAIARLMGPRLNRRGGRARLGGGWLLVVGVWGLVSEFRLWDLDYSRSWPLLVIGAGIMIVVRALVVGAYGCGRGVESR